MILPFYYKIINRSSFLFLVLEFFKQILIISIRIKRIHIFKSVFLNFENFIILILFYDIGSAFRFYICRSSTLFQ